MEETKIRYVFKNRYFCDLSFYYLSLKEIEDGALDKIQQSGMIENGYELINQDKYTNFK